MNVGIYESEQYRAFVYDRKVTICTNLQCFRIVPPTAKQCEIDELKVCIASGIIKSLPDLAEHSKQLKWENCERPNVL